jgi:hypothetical protein
MKAQKLVRTLDRFCYLVGQPLHNKDYCAIVLALKQQAAGAASGKAITTLILHAHSTPILLAT